MATIGQRNDPVRLMGRRILLVGLLILTIAAVSGVWNIYRKERESADLNAEAQAQLADLEAQQTQLDGNIDQLETERGMEAALREQYNMGKTGEGLIVIVEPQAEAPAQATSSIMEWLHEALPWW